ncbi:MAG: hypothetical protein CMG57_03465 [Candidatus Marinimicrobia bacterium]|nr:hypothetical protein [Candidatus Neomarinimicrobiota bacterium]
MMEFLLYTIINNAFNLIQILILIRVVMSWIPHDPYNQLSQLIYQITDLILKPIRETLPLHGAGVDFSPILAFFFLGVLKKLLLSVI